MTKPCIAETPPKLGDMDSKDSPLLLRDRKREQSLFSLNPPSNQRLQRRNLNQREIVIEEYAMDMTQLENYYVSNDWLKDFA